MAKSRKGKGNVLKVIRLGLEDRVFKEMRKPDFSAEALSRELESEGTSISAQSIRKFIRKSKEAQKELISKDLREMEKFKKFAINYKEKINDIIEEVEEVKNMSREEKDMTTYNQLVGRLYQGIELMAKLVDDLKPDADKIDVNLIYNQIEDKLDKKMKEVDDIFQNTSKEIDYEILEQDKEFAKEKLGEIEVEENDS